jgi:IS5 family transposase
VITTAANVNDVTQTVALVDGIPPVAGRVGHPRKQPAALLGDKGYDSNPNRRELRKRGILPVISRRGEPDIIGLGKLRYVVEQTSAQLHQFKRLAVRWERRLDLHNAFVSLGFSLICWRRLNKQAP